MRFLTLLPLHCSWLFTAVPAIAQDAFPSRPMRLIVPFPAGRPTDVFARQYAAHMSSILGQQMVAENKSVPRGAISSLEVARATPDGYTLLFGTASTHGLYNLLSKSPQYDSIEGFCPDRYRWLCACGDRRESVAAGRSRGVW